jgi:flagellar hook-basal body complex protein FliE
MMNIASIMAKVLPGTFAPDMRTDEKPTISAIPGLTGTGAAGALPDNDPAHAVGGVDGAPSFKDTVKALLSDVNDKLNTSDHNTRDLATGKTNDLNTVVTSVEEANLSLQYTMAIRTKLLDAYNEIERMAI